MERKNLISLAGIPVGEMIPDGDYQIGYRDSVICNGQEVEYFLKLPNHGNGRRVDIQIFGYIQRVSRDDEENGHGEIPKKEEEKVKEAIRLRVRRLPVSKDKGLQFNFLK